MLVDPDGTTAAQLERAEIAVPPVASLDDVAPGSVAVIGRGAPESAADWERLERLVEDGARALALRPEKMPEMWCGVDWRLAAEPNNYAFPFMPEGGSRSSLGQRQVRRAHTPFAAHPITRSCAT